MILAMFSGMVGVIAMPTLAAILIVVAVGSLRVGRIQSILCTGPTSRIAMIATALGRDRVQGVL
jgi:SulP family sulfate permease